MTIYQPKNQGYVTLHVNHSISYLTRKWQFNTNECKVLSLRSSFLFLNLFMRLYLRHFFFLFRTSRFILMASRGVSYK